MGERGGKKCRRRENAMDYRMQRGRNGRRNTPKGLASHPVAAHLVYPVAFSTSPRVPSQHFPPRHPPNPLLATFPGSSMITSAPAFSSGCHIAVPHNVCIQVSYHAYIYYPTHKLLHLDTEE